MGQQIISVIMESCTFLWTWKSCKNKSILSNIVPFIQITASSNCTTPAFKDYLPLYRSILLTKQSGANWILVKLVQGSCELRRGEKIIFLVIFCSAYFKCSVEWRGDFRNPTQHSLPLANHESDFPIRQSKLKLVFFARVQWGKHKFDLAPENFKSRLVIHYR